MDDYVCGDITCPCADGMVCPQEPVCSTHGCCSACGGTGTSREAETNGQCWDCRGTGHAHA